jgi:hypothetical protein
VPGIRSGAGRYLARLAGLGAPADRLAVSRLRQVTGDVAAGLYRGQADRPAGLVEFSDGAFGVLFDAANERTVLMRGLSRQAPPDGRDASYHRGFPGRAGFGKGHAISHARGGREGGPNYFPHAGRVSRRLSPAGALWRDIESYLAGHPGLFCCVRLIYPAGSSTDVPAEAEYGAAAGGQFRVVIFPNT